MYPVIDAFGQVARLTRREYDVARLASFGYSDREIASEIGLSEASVSSHLEGVRRKLFVNNRLKVALCMIGRRDLIG